MSLKPCRECGKEISSQARICPHCGAKVPRRTGVVGWIVAIGLGVWFVTLFDDRPAPPPTTSAPARPAAIDAYQAAIRDLKLDFQWKLGGFGNVMLADLTLVNKGSRPVKDIAIRCTAYGPSGTAITTTRRTLYVSIAAGKTLRIPEFNMGFHSDQAASAGCLVYHLVVL